MANDLEPVRAAFTPPRRALRMAKPVLAVTAALAALLVVARPSLGDPAPSTPPPAPSSPVGGPGMPPTIVGNLEMAAELLEVDTKTQIAVLSGKVQLARGDLSLGCPRIEAKLDGNGGRVLWAKGTGGVVADVKGTHAEAQEFDLDLEKQHLSLRGGVRVYRTNGWLAADGAEFDLAAGKLTMTNVKASVPVGSTLKK